MRLVWDEQANVSAWVASRIPHMAGSEGFGPCQAVAVVGSQMLQWPDGRWYYPYLGGVVFHAYQPTYRNIEVSFASASPRWLTRALISEILEYPFGQLGCRRITTLTPAKAKPARQFLDDFGFKREGCVRFGFGDDHMIVSGLLAKEWAASRFNRARVKGKLGTAASGLSSSQDASLTPPPSDQPCVAVPFQRNPDGQAAAPDAAGPDADRERADELERADGALPVEAEQREQLQPVRFRHEPIRPLDGPVDAEHQPQPSRAKPVQPGD